MLQATVSLPEQNPRCVTDTGLHDIIPRTKGCCMIKLENTLTEYQEEADSATPEETTTAEECGAEMPVMGHGADVPSTSEEHPTHAQSIPTIPARNGALPDHQPASESSQRQPAGAGSRIKEGSPPKVDEIRHQGNTSLSDGRATHEKRKGLVEGPQPPLSKKQAKRLAKREAIAASKLARKEAQRQKKRRQAEERKAARAAEYAGLSEEQKAEMKKEHVERMKALREEASAARERCQKALVDGQRVIIDMGFESFMKDSEIRSLCKQVQYSYSYSSKAENPAHLILTSCTGMMKERMEQTCDGYDRWPITVHEKPYTEVVDDVKDLVYLTADSHNVVEELDPSKAYIVGGLVDRNRYKGVCYDKARSQGIATARLPLAQHLALMGSPILTVNHVVAILIEFQKTKDWGAALRFVVPPRKMSKRPSPDVVVNANSVPLAKKPCTGTEPELIFDDAAKDSAAPSQE